MQVNTATKSSDKVPTGPEVPVKAELLDKDGSSIGPVKASKKENEPSLEDLHSAPDISSSNNSSTGSENKEKTSKIKKILIGVGIAIVAFLGLKFLFRKKN